MEEYLRDLVEDFREKPRSPPLHLADLTAGVIYPVDTLLFRTRLIFLDNC